MVMLVLQSQMSIEPVGMSSQLHSLHGGREGGEREEGGGMQETGTLPCPQNAEVNWRENQEVGKFPYH